MKKRFIFGNQIWFFVALVLFIQCNPGHKKGEVVLLHKPKIVLMMADDLGEMNDLSSLLPEKVTTRLSPQESWEIEPMDLFCTGSTPRQRVAFEMYKALMENREVIVKSLADLLKLDNKQTI